jgi:hypothetical protein
MATATVNYDSTTDTNALTITLASLATSATMVAGRQSTVVSNASTKYVDVILSGQVTVGTTPTTAKTIAVYVFAPIKIVSSTASYPIATTTQLGESDAAATFEADQRNALRLAGTMSVIATSDRAYSLEPVSIASLFGGVMPIKWGIFVTHDTAVNLNSTAGNHWFHWTGIKYDVA